MKITGNVVGIGLALVGAIFALQGLNILPGSGMTGHSEWAVIGAVMIVAGAALLVLANRRGGRAGS